ncbi:MAG: alpha/beta fold hydrolase [Actinomycetota bacterium]|nr:alpha/beta fold hydrolase [Actinomycetota bacterium]
MSRCTLVWAHGLVSSRAHEDELGLFDWSVPETSATVVRYDARGHGESEAMQYYDRAFRWPCMVDDMLRAGGTEAFVAGGVDMGGAVALWTALRAPKRVQAMVLVAPPPAWELRGPGAEQCEKEAQVVEARGLPAWADDVRRRPQPRIFAEELPRAGDVTARHLLTMDTKAVPAILRGAAASDLPTRDEIRALVVPTLILAWTDDPAHPVEMAESLADLLVLSELHVAKDLAAIRAWPDLVRDFLAELCCWE